jgi:hypothetical protein
MVVFVCVCAIVNPLVVVVTGREEEEEGRRKKTTTDERERDPSPTSAYFRTLLPVVLAHGGRREDIHDGEHKDSRRSRSSINFRGKFFADVPMETGLHSTSNLSDVSRKEIGFSSSVRPSAAEHGPSIDGTCTLDESRCTFF